MDDDQLVEIDEKPFVVTKDGDGNDIAIPVDDSYALVRLKEAEAAIAVANTKGEIAKTTRTGHVTTALVFVVFWAGLFSWCTFG
jgi:hypothetical protein